MSDKNKLEEDYLNDLLNSILTSEDINEEDIQELGAVSDGKSDMDEKRDTDEKSDTDEEDKTNELSNQEDIELPVGNEEQIAIENKEEDNEESSVSEEYLLNLLDDSLALDENSEMNLEELSLEELSLENIETSSNDYQEESTIGNMMESDLDQIDRLDDANTAILENFEIEDRIKKQEPEQNLEIIEDKNTKAKKSNGIFSKILGIFSKTKEENNEEKQEELEQNAADNQNILNELDANEESTAKKKKAKDKKSKKAKKGKGKNSDTQEDGKKSKNKKDKTKKDKKSKEKTAIKEKEEVIKISLKGILFLITFIVIVILTVKIGGNLFSYNQDMNKAREYFLDKNYNRAYNLISGLEFKDSDEDFYNQLRIIMVVYQEYVSYENFTKLDMKAEALDSLILGVANYEKYKGDADELGVLPDLNYSYDLIISNLKEEYNLSKEQAKELAGIKDRKEYSKEIYSIVN